MSDFLARDFRDFPTFDFRLSRLSGEMGEKVTPIYGQNMKKIGHFLYNKN